MVGLAPVLAVLLTMALGAIIFSSSATTDLRAVDEIFIEPLVDVVRVAGPRRQGGAARS